MTPSPLPLALTPEQIEKIAQAPQSVTIDGDSATQRSALDLVELLRYADAKRAAAEGRPPMRSYRTVPPGTVADSSRPY